jgi:hypothetical protein
VRGQLGRSQCISKIDLKAGYFNVPMSPRSAKLTSFQTTKGRFHWTRMAQGLQNAPAHFQQVMETVLEGLPVAILLDDVTTKDDDVEANVDSAADAIIRLAEAGAMVGLYKGVVGAEEVEFMGDMWAAGGYWRPCVDKV